MNPPKLESYVDETLYELHRPLFETLLKQSAGGDEACFEHRLKTFTYHGLLDFFSELPYKPKPVLDQYSEDKNGDRIYTFAENQLAAPTWKRRLIRKLKTQRPSGVYTRHRLEISRKQIVDDQKYVADIAKVLAYKWVTLLGRCSTVDCVTLVRLIDADALIHFLEGLRFNVRLSSMRSFLLHRETDKLLDNDKFKQLFAHIENRLKLAGQNASAELQQIGGGLPRVTLGEVLDDVGDRLKFVDEMHSWSDGEKPYVALMLDKCAHNGLTDASFSRAVDARIARRKAARKRLLSHWRRSRHHWYVFRLSVRTALISSTALLLIFHTKFGLDQVTIADLLSKWLSG